MLKNDNIHNNIKSLLIPLMMKMMIEEMNKMDNSKKSKGIKELYLQMTSNTLSLQTRYIYQFTDSLRCSL